jgi:hypothetical protein
LTSRRLGSRLGLRGLLLSRFLGSLRSLGDDSLLDLLVLVNVELNAFLENYWVLILFAHRVRIPCGRLRLGLVLRGRLFVCGLLHRRCPCGCNREAGVVVLLIR